MNLIEGSKRMQRAGRTLFPISLSILVVFVALSAFAYQSNYFVIRGILNLLSPLFIWLCGITLISGAMLWIAGWILEGFAEQAPEN